MASTALAPRLNWHYIRCTYACHAVTPRIGRASRSAKLAADETRTKQPGSSLVLKRPDRSCRVNTRRRRSSRQLDEAPQVRQETPGIDPQCFARVKTPSAGALVAKTTPLSDWPHARNEPRRRRNRQTAKFFRQGQPNVNTRARPQNARRGDVGRASRPTAEQQHPRRPLTRAAETPTKRRGLDGHPPRRKPRLHLRRRRQQPARPVLRRGVPGPVSYTHLTLPTTPYV